MSLLAQLDQRIRHHGGLIVSCQPVPGSPLDNPAIVAAMALAAEQAGAVALRIEGLANLQAVRPLVTVPVIGLIKRDLPDSPVRITPGWKISTRWRRAERILLLLTAPSVSVRRQCRRY